MWPHIDKHMEPKYPGGQTTLRFIAKNVVGKASNNIVNDKINASPQNIIEILNIFAKNNIEFLKIENLYHFNGNAGYSAIQGE